MSKNDKVQRGSLKGENFFFAFPRVSEDVLKEAKFRIFFFFRVRVGVRARKHRLRGDWRCSSAQLYG